MGKSPLPQAEARRQTEGHRNGDEGSQPVGFAPRVTPHGSFHSPLAPAPVFLTLPSIVLLTTCHLLTCCFPCYETLSFYFVVLSISPH